VLSEIPKALLAIPISGIETLNTGFQFLHSTIENVNTEIEISDSNIEILNRCVETKK